MTEGESLIRHAYAAFNRKDADVALSLMQADVSWADGEGRMLHGREAIRAHRAAQWRAAEVTLEPLGFTPSPGERIAVDVRMRTRDHRDGTTADRVIENLFVVKNGLIERMEIPDV